MEERTGQAAETVMSGELEDQATTLDSIEAQQRVSFGPAPGNSIPLDWAQPLLWRLHAAHPAAFGKQLVELYAERRLGQAFTVTTKRRRGG
jgi:hypothetical protein